LPVYARINFPIIKTVNKRIVVFLCVFFLSIITVFSQDLSVGGDDLRLEQRSDEGFHLFIRKKPDIASVLLTESTIDPTMEADNYAYRALEWNPINGDEIRLLDGYPIPRESRIFSLVSSTPQPHPELGEAFHIFIPWIVNYGYEYTRNGVVQMTNGAFINIRTFSYPYADYRGVFADNPFILHGIQRADEKEEEEHPEEPGEIEETEESFRSIAREGKGDFSYASDPSDLINKIEDLLQQELGKSVDIVLCLDTTGSMGKYIDGVKKMLIPMMSKMISGFTDWRIGMVLYRDYPPDLYITRLTPFTKEFNVFQRNLNAAAAWGGGDIPEAVYEALYEGADKFPWAAESRLLILMGDAPPHPVQKGAISREMVFQKAEENGLKVNAILLQK